MIEKGGHLKIPREEGHVHNGDMEGGRLWCLTQLFNNISVISWRSVLLVEETGEPGRKPCTHLSQVTDKTLAQCKLTDGEKHFMLHCEINSNLKFFYY